VKVWYDDREMVFVAPFLVFPVEVEVLHPLSYVPTCRTGTGKEGYLNGSSSGESSALATF
jgi:hypothetical protein